MLPDWQEWEALGVKIELWSREKAPNGLLREERESCVNFVGTDTYTEILAARPDWMRRIERLGVTPTRIEAYEKGDGERRWYQIPVSWVRRPYPPASGNKGGKHHAWQKWAEMGVPVQHSADSFPRAEQETSSAFTDAETMMEIGTCNKSWHRRLEAEGCRPRFPASRPG